MNRLEFFASCYIEENWNDFSRCFKETSLEVEGIPQDIVNALVVIIGKEAQEWLKRPLSCLDGKRAIELASNEQGCRALKEVIMRMPN